MLILILLQICYTNNDNTHFSFNSIEFVDVSDVTILDMFHYSTIRKATISSKTAVYYFNKENFRSGNIIYATEHLSLAAFMVLFRKQSCLTAPVNKIIGSFAQNGLIYHWEKRYLQPDLNSPKVWAAYHNNGPVSFKLEKIIFIFQMVSMLQFVALLVFLLEILSIYCTKIRKIIDFLTY